MSSRFRWLPAVVALCIAPFAAIAQQPSASSGAHASASSRQASPGDSVWVVVYEVRPDKRRDYEGFVTRFWRTGLDSGAPHDPTVLSAFRHTRVPYPARMNPDSTWSYMVRPQ